MPEIARFFGIVIQMYAEVGGPHHRPHFHAHHHERGGVYALDKVELVAGSLPKSGWCLHGRNIIERS